MRLNDFSAPRVRGPPIGVISAQDGREWRSFAPGAAASPDGAGQKKLKNLFFLLTRRNSRGRIRGIMPRIAWGAGATFPFVTRKET
jgi:hypothetical protein